MSTSDPQNDVPSSLAKAVLEGIKGLPAILRFTVVFAILIVLVINESRLARGACRFRLLPVYWGRFYGFRVVLSPGSPSGR